MLRWALIFSMAAAFTAFVGFGPVAGAASGIAMMLFWICVALFLVSLLVILLGGRSTPTS